MLRHLPGTRTWRVHCEGSTEKSIAENGNHTDWRFDRCGVAGIRFTSLGGAIQ
jgi:hypothetical protein